MPRTVNPPAIAVAHSVRRTEIRMCCSLTEEWCAAQEGHEVVCSSSGRRAQDVTQSGEQPGWYAGPPVSRARLPVQRSRRTAGVASNDGSTTPAGAEAGLVPDRLGEAQGPGSDGGPGGASRGERD